jgi:ankyrin repeat protein
MTAGAAPAVTALVIVARERPELCALSIVSRTFRFDRGVQRALARDARGRFGRSALMFSAHVNDPDRISLLIALGASVHARDCDAWTPLHFAAANGNEASVRALLAHGADARAVTTRGITALILAQHIRCGASTRALIAAGA